MRVRAREVREHKGRRSAKSETSQAERQEGVLGKCEWTAAGWEKLTRD